MNRVVYHIDEIGFIIDNYVGKFNENGEIITEFPGMNIVIEPLPQPLPFHKPKWNGVEWVEGATQEEIDELTKVEPSPPTQDERIKMLEDTINFLLEL